ncbi:uncharacterized protein BDZ83DRAFT_784617 [Colletotrichum acutatum]|uniref:Uncharacterized protein n=1 Tax=Glomerella acutata TaxID=27357 RepID=A0AAD8UDF4_GLOAC|nr:uncharacterized protein BDZ83DRAFT_784617 [Colletotrichum acutatum]KAK1721361.1 hypothetical protein BDZ83DRAFT_784617 [Colletotrichum acutatum]
MKGLLYFTMMPKSCRSTRRGIVYCVFHWAEGKIQLRKIPKSAGWILSGNPFWSDGTPRTKSVGLFGLDGTKYLVLHRLVISLGESSVYQGGSHWIVPFVPEQIYGTCSWVAPPIPDSEGSTYMCPSRSLGAALVNLTDGNLSDTCNANIGTQLSPTTLFRLTSTQEPKPPPSVDLASSSTEVPAQLASRSAHRSGVTHTLRLLRVCSVPPSPESPSQCISVSLDTRKPFIRVRGGRYDESMVPSRQSCSEPSAQRIHS